MIKDVHWDRVSVVERIALGFAIRHLREALQGGPELRIAPNAEGGDPRQAAAHTLFTE